MRPPPETYWATVACVGPCRGCDCADKQQWADLLDRLSPADREWINANRQLAANG